MFLETQQCVPLFCMRRTAFCHFSDVRMLNLTKFSFYFISSHIAFGGSGVVRALVINIVFVSTIIYQPDTNAILQTFV